MSPVMNHALKLAWVVGAALAAVACGDNNRECGENTELVDGFCVGTGGPAMCTNGTVLDEATNYCVIDPNACQGGTVLIGNECQDPTAGLTIDVTEAAEPNGAGFIETSTTPAGVLELKPVGEKLVIKGTTNPFRDDNDDGQLDADYDSYFFEVDGPTLLDVTVDGTNGTMSAFAVVATAEGNPVNQSATGWIRYGMNVTGDASKRQVFIPAAGVYLIAFADTRSMYIESASPPAAGFGGAAGNAEAHYYATIERLALPTPMPIALTDGVGSATGTTSGDVKFYSTTMGTGINDVTVEMDSPSAAPSLVLLRNGGYKDNVDGAPANTIALGYRASDTATIVVDHTYAYGPNAQPYEVLVQTAGATALSTSGGMASETIRATAFADFFSLHAFYFDVDATDAINGVSLTWSQPVDGLLVDENLLIIARFSYNNGFTTNRSWTTYTGLIRTPSPGRYYFLVYPRTGTVGTDMLTATSTIEGVTAVPVVKGTPLAGQMVNETFDSNAFTYSPGVSADAWQQFAVNGTGTGDRSSRFYNLSTAYGRLDPVTLSTGTAVNDATPVFTTTHTANDAPVGRILLDDNAASYLVVVNTVNDTGTLELDFERRPHVDFGTLAPGAMQSRDDLDLDAAPVQRFLLRTGVGNRVTLAANPDNLLLDTRIQTHGVTENVLATINTAGVGAEDSTTFQQVGNGWTAFTVSSALALPLGTNTVDVSVQVQGPPYTVANTTTAYADACAGGMVIPYQTGDGDEGRTAAIALPPNFDFFGTAVTNVYAGSNGFASFSPIGGSVGNFFYTNADIPSTGAPNNLVAPYWDDLDVVEICAKTDGTKLIVQWDGSTYGGLFEAPAPIAFQAIFDSADDSIEFVYGTAHQPNGSGATIGLENATASQFAKLGYNTANVVTPGTGKKLTPAP